MKSTGKILAALAAAIAFSLLLTGCFGGAGGGNAPEDPTVAGTGANSGNGSGGSADAGSHQPAPGQNGNGAGGSKGAKREPLRFVEEELTLEPGQTYRLATNHTDGVSFESSHPDRVSVDSFSGEIRVSDLAASGTEVTVTAKRGDETAEARITIRAAMPAAVTPGDGDIPVVSNPDSLTVLVNKQRGLPADYVPEDLVVPDVPFSFSGEHEKKHLREPAARALEALFRKAEEDGIELAAVSGYRSYGTQKSIFNWNVQTQGEEEARRYSAYPGTSEHQTGLAMDVSSRSVNYGLIEEFGETAEGKWLAENCAEFGFIIRYPDGKEHITGYAYEPWHLRYVGTDIAAVIMSSGITLEEYFEGAIPVSQDE